MLLSDVIKRARAHTHSQITVIFSQTITSLALSLSLGCAVGVISADHRRSARFLRVVWSTALLKVPRGQVKDREEVDWPIGGDSINCARTPPTVNYWTIIEFHFQKGVLNDSHPVIYCHVFTWEAQQWRTRRTFVLESFVKKFVVNFTVCQSKRND